jgi:hypothetical protein
MQQRDRIARRPRRRLQRGFGTPRTCAQRPRRSDSSAPQEGQACQWGRSQRGLRSLGQAGGSGRPEHPRPYTSHCYAGRPIAATRWAADEGAPPQGEQRNACADESAGAERCAHGVVCGMYLHASGRHRRTSVQAAVESGTCASSRVAQAN